MNPRPVAMTIAGSDSGGGAGIQADIRTFASHGVFGASVITALTAQNTVTVAGVHAAPAEFVSLQMRTVLDDIPVQAVKTGMLFNAEIINAVAKELSAVELTLVVDPVMIAKSGDALLEEDAIDALVSRIIPLAFCITPNIPEAERLSGMKIGDIDDMKKAAEKIVDLGAKNVVVKGGHMPGSGTVTDLALVDGGFVEFAHKRYDTSNTHGTGCTFSASITARLAKGVGVRSAVGGAAEYISNAIQGAMPLGRGHGPVEHFF